MCIDQNKETLHLCAIVIKSNLTPMCNGHNKATLRLCVMAIIKQHYTFM